MRNRQRRQHDDGDNPQKSCHPTCRVGTIFVVILLNLTKSGVQCLATGNSGSFRNINNRGSKGFPNLSQDSQTAPASFRVQSFATGGPPGYRGPSAVLRLQASSSDSIDSSSSHNNESSTPNKDILAPDINAVTPIKPPTDSLQHETQHRSPPPEDPPSAAPTSMNTSTDHSQKQQRTSKPKLWPCGDKMDKELIKISVPVIGNYAISPLIGAVDLFWVNRMGNALAVAGQAASNQVFSSAFWFVSFLPSVTATLVSKQHAKGDQEGTQDAVCQALFVGFFIALIGTPIMFFNPDCALSSVLAPGAPAMEYARPYLLIRSFAFLPSLVSLVGFSAFRGILDTKTPVKISALANVFNALLDPILIFALCMGVPGAAMATLAAEVISAAIYLTLMRKRKLILFRKLIKPPSWVSLEPLLKGGLALQLRNLSLNLTFLAVARVTQSIDRSGVAAAAHAMAIQTFQIGGIVLLALSTVAQTIVPNAMIEKYDQETKQSVGGLEFANATVNRLMSWGLILGCGLGLLQILLLPVIRKATPIQEVRDAAKIPAVIASVLQVINGLVFIGEGVMIGTGSFLQLSLSTLVATIGCLWALWFFPPKIGLAGVWLGFCFFNVIRLIGVYIHQRINGPLSPANMKIHRDAVAQHD
ncbi:MATE efflux family protein [Nitzschia inconspicua]|uniref:MATE efflux family protein n=1 Tax=Nitzschia inconspicua TaxID=303405 RepID=A0A9K3LVC8_9STRA|nr:MATE efflux family protein [Nitzschia inconspicua]